MQKEHPLVKHLQSVTIHALCEVKGPVQLKTISQDGHLEQALSLMSENNILSLPVQLEEHSLDYVGFIDVLDVIFFIIQTCTEGKNLEEAQWSSWCQDIHTLSHRGIRFGLKRIKALMDASNKDHWNPVSPSGTLSQLIEVFATGVHRAPVVDSLGVVTNIISQSDIVRFISEHMTSGHPFDQTVQQLHLGTREVIDMSSSAQTIHAFYLMFANKVSAVAIVDAKGELVANLSASDVRGLHAENFTKLLMPVSQFLKSQHNRKAPVTVTLNTTLETVLHKLVWFRLHRVWIVDESNKPIGVISLTDIMNIFNVTD